MNIAQVHRDVVRPKVRDILFTQTPNIHFFEYIHFRATKRLANKKKIGIFFKILLTNIVYNATM